MSTDCDQLHARAHMLHHEADQSLCETEAGGHSWKGFSDQIAIALRCEVMALRVQARIEEEC